MLIICHTFIQDVPQKRRDKRKGCHVGHVERTPEGPAIKIQWEDPYGGECVDTFILSESGAEMTQITEMFFRGTQEYVNLKCAAIHVQHDRRRVNECSGCGNFLFLLYCMHLLFKRIVHIDCLSQVCLGANMLVFGIQGSVPAGALMS